MTKKKTPAEKATKKPTAITMIKETVVRGPRRSPYDLVQDLKTKRDHLDDTYAGKRAKLDDKIEALEAKWASRIAVSELIASRTPEELAAEFEDLKRQQGLLRKAMRHGAR